MMNDKKGPRYLFIIGIFVATIKTLKQYIDNGDIEACREVFSKLRYDEDVGRYFREE